MKCLYEFEIKTKCPVDFKGDRYEVTLESSDIIEVEKIIEVVKKLKEKTQYQEKTTFELARELRCITTTVGYHSGIKTTVRA